MGLNENAHLCFGKECPVVVTLRAELAAAREAADYHEKLYLEAIADLAKLRALLSSARLAMRICIPKPSCHSIDVIAQIDEAIGEAGVHCSAWRGEG